MDTSHYAAMNNPFGAAHMAFVREKIDSPELRLEREKLHLVSPVTRAAFDEPRWFVDRANGLYFVELGGGLPEIPFVFGLADQRGLLLEAHAREEMVGEYLERNIELTWKVSAVMIRREYAANADALVTSLRDALESYGLLGDKSVTKSVRVEVPAPKFV